MRRDHEIVHFFEHNARTYRVNDPTLYIGLSNVAINPNLNQLRAEMVPQHYWKYVDGLVVEKNEEEKRAADIFHNNVEQTHPLVIEKVIEKIVPVEVEKIKYVDRIEYQDRVEVIYRVPKWVYWFDSFMLVLLATVIVKLFDTSQ